MKTVQVGLIGFGTVGAGVARLLLEEGEGLARRSGGNISLTIDHAAGARTGSPIPTPIRQKK